MVLAAGKGSRLRPLTNDIPKPLIPIHGRPMIDYALGYLQKNGVDEVIINVHHLADDLKEYFNSNSFSGKVKITLSDESGKLLDTGGGLKKASWFFDDKNPFFLLASDVFTNLDLKKLMAWHIQKQNLVTLAVKKRETSRSLLFNHDFLLKGWIDNRTGEKLMVGSGQQKCPYALGFSGIHVISPELFHHFPPEHKFSIIPFYLNLASEYPIRGYVHNDDEWMEFGRLKNFEQEALEKKVLTFVKW